MDRASILVHLDPISIISSGKDQTSKLSKAHNEKEKNKNKDKDVSTEVIMTAGDTISIQTYGTNLNDEILQSLFHQPEQVPITFPPLEREDTGLNNMISKARWPLKMALKKPPLGMRVLFIFYLNSSGVNLIY